MNVTTQSHSPASPNQSINNDDMNYICRSTTLSDFQERCSRFSYSQAYQVYSDLSARVSNIRRQLDERGVINEEWHKKTTAALSIMGQKQAIVHHRLSSMRDNHIQLLMEDIGGVGYVASKRLVMIKCLIHVIDHYANISSLSSIEKSVLDACRLVSDTDIIPKFASLTYNSISNSIQSLDGTKIAEVVIQGCMAEEYGYMFAASSSMQRLLVRAELLADRTADNFTCSPENHDPENCMACMSSKLNDDIIDLLTELK